jgi:hypothetical protein
MKRDEAVEYLERKGQLSERKFTKNDEVKIKEVEKKGKIYGDPIVELEY